MYLFSNVYAHIWLHISAVEGQGDLQDASTNSEAEVLLSLSASLIPMFSSPLALSSSKDIAAISTYTKVVITIYVDKIAIITALFIILPFNIIYAIYYN